MNLNYTVIGAGNDDILLGSSGDDGFQGLPGDDIFGVKGSQKLMQMTRMECW